MKTPSQIINKLDKRDQDLLNSILSVEKSKMHVQNIKTNSRDEKDLVKAIVKIIDEAVTDAN